jgi:hypothetical protein
MKSKIVTGYWMDCVGYPFQGTGPIRKERYLGSLIAHCQNIQYPIICYTHERSLHEVEKVKRDYNLENLEIKILELYDAKYHSEIDAIRNSDVPRYTRELDGRGCEIMWSKFLLLERELKDCDRIYWLDVGLQHPGLFTWSHSKKYNKPEEHVGLVAPWWADYDVYNFPNFINKAVFQKLDQITEGKVTLLASIQPQISYPFRALGILEKPFESPYPVGALVGGDPVQVQKYVNAYWHFAELLLEKNTLVTEESIMKPALDSMNPEDVLLFTFERFHCCEHDQFHFSKWEESWGEPKPLYMVIHDILNY